MPGELVGAVEERRVLVQELEPVGIADVRRCLVSDEHEETGLVAVLSHNSPRLVHAGEVQPPAAAAAVQPFVDSGIFQRLVNADDLVLHSKGEAQYTPFPVAVVAAEKEGTAALLEEWSENFRIFVNEMAAKFRLRQGEAFYRFEEDIAEVLVEFFCKQLYLSSLLLGECVFQVFTDGLFSVF